MPSGFKALSAFTDFENMNKPSEKITSRLRKLAFCENETKPPKRKIDIRIQLKSIKKDKSQT